MSQHQHESEHKQEDEQVTPTQWMIGAVSTLLVLMLLGALFYQAWTSTPGVPDISFRQERVVPVQHGYVVEFVAHNTGAATAQDLSVEGVLREGGKIVETSRTTLAFAPPQGERRGGLIFFRDPRRYRLEIRAQGYDRP